MPLRGLNRLNFLTRYPAILLTLGLVSWFEAIFTIEWSFSYCSSQEDGPASAVFGMPFPYIRWSQVSSLEYVFVPSILLLNILILFAIAFPLVSWAVKKVASPDQRRRRNMMSFAGLVLLLTISAWTLFLVQLGAYRHTDTVGDENYGSYSEFRPVRFSFKDLHYQCTPSNYWFKDGWRPKTVKEAGATN